MSRKRDDSRTVRDAMWAWAHYEGSYNHSWGLPGNSSITPVEGAKWLGVPNIIMVRYNDLTDPKPPLDRYAAPFQAMRKVMWSFGGTNQVAAEKRLEAEQRLEGVFALAVRRPNITGLFIDDFFAIPEDEPPHWFADDCPEYPILLTITLPVPATIDKVELTQATWKMGDHRSAGFAVELSADGKKFTRSAEGILPNVFGAMVITAVPKRRVRAVRIKILGTHDTDKRLTCGLRRIRLWNGDRCLNLKNCTARDSSHYPGWPLDNALDDEAYLRLPPPAAMTIAQLRRLRKRLAVNGRKLDLGLTLYTYQLQPRVALHLKCFDIVSLWTWKPVDIAFLEQNLAKLEALAPGKRIMLGLYMWDFNANRPMPLDAMKRQCELALQWLHEGRIEGMIFLATNIVNLNLDAANWSRAWIAEVGDQPVLLK